MYLVISTGHKTPQYIHPICITARIRMFRLIADKLGTDKFPCLPRRLIHCIYNNITIDNHIWRAEHSCPLDSLIIRKDASFSFVH
jgi:hypothetical protein